MRARPIFFTPPLFPFRGWLRARARTEQFSEVGARELEHERLLVGDHGRLPLLALRVALERRLAEKLELLHHAEQLAQRLAILLLVRCQLARLDEEEGVVLSLENFLELF